MERAAVIKAGEESGARAKKLSASEDHLVCVLCLAHM